MSNNPTPRPPSISIPDEGGNNENGVRNTYESESPILSGLDSSSALILIHDESDDEEGGEQREGQRNGAEDEEDGWGYTRRRDPQAIPLSLSSVFLYLLSPYLKLGALLLPVTSSFSLRITLPALFGFAFIAAFTRQIWYMLSRYLRTRGNANLEEVLLLVFCPGGSRNAASKVRTRTKWIRGVIRIAVKGVTMVISLIMASLYLSQATRALLASDVFSTSLSSTTLVAVLAVLLYPLLTSPVSSELASRRVIYSTWASIACFGLWWICVLYAFGHGVYTETKGNGGEGIKMPLGSLWTGITLIAFTFSSPTSSPSSSLGLYASLKAGRAAAAAASTRHRRRISNLRTHSNSQSNLNSSNNHPAHLRTNSNSTTLILNSNNKKGTGTNTNRRKTWFKSSFTTTCILSIGVALGALVPLVVLASKAKADPGPGEGETFAFALSDDTLPADVASRLAPFIHTLSAMTLLLGIPQVLVGLPSLVHSMVTCVSLPGGALVLLVARSRRSDGNGNGSRNRDRNNAVRRRGTGTETETEPEIRRRGAEREIEIRNRSRRAAHNARSTEGIGKWFIPSISKILMWVVVVGVSLILAPTGERNERGWREMVEKVISNIVIAFALSGTYLLPAIVHITAHFIKKPLSIIMPQPTAPAPHPMTPTTAGLPPSSSSTSASSGTGPSTWAETLPPIPPSEAERGDEELDAGKGERVIQLSSGSESQSASGSGSGSGSRSGPPAPLALPPLPSTLHGPPSSYIPPSGYLSSSYEPETEPEFPDSASDPLLQRKESQLQRAQFTRRIVWDMGVMVILVPLGGLGVGWGIWTLVR